MTPGNWREVKLLDALYIEAGAISIMDRAYLDFPRLYRAHQSHAYCGGAIWASPVTD